jgi:hypothetical protein
MKIKNIYVILFTLILLGLLIPPFAHGGTAVGEYKENVKLSEIVIPSVFGVNVHGIYTDTDPKTNVETHTFCMKGVGTAYTVSENGYFATNDHVTNPTPKIEECLINVARKRNVPTETLLSGNVSLYYALSDQASPKHIFPVVITKSFFPKTDLIVLNVSKVWGDTQKELFNISPTYPEKYIPVNFRTKLPKIAKPMSKRFPLVASYEPVGTVGMPFGLPNTFMRGMLGANFFNQDGFDFMHFMAPITQGSSGAPIYSLLDWKCIGMVKNGVQGQNGAIPFWVIQEALATVDMK